MRITISKNYEVEDRKSFLLFYKNGECVGHIAFLKDHNTMSNLQTVDFADILLDVLESNFADRYEFNCAEYLLHGTSKKR